jgi:hypothetical protein
VQFRKHQARIAESPTAQVSIICKGEESLSGANLCLHINVEPNLDWQVPWPFFRRDWGNLPALCELACEGIAFAGLSTKMPTCRSALLKSDFASPSKEASLAFSLEVITRPTLENNGWGGGI